MSTYAYEPPGPLADRREFPDVEDALVTWMGTVIALLRDPLDPDRHVGSEAPVDLAERLPFGRVELIDGRDDEITDVGTYDIDIFDETRAGARLIAETVRQGLLGYPLVVGSVVIDYVATESKPRRLPWADENVRRFGATYRISARR